MTRSIYKLMADIIEIEDALYALYENKEVTPEQIAAAEDALFTAMLDNESDISAKVDGVYAIVANKKSRIEGLNEEIAKLRSEVSSEERSVDSIKRLLTSYMNAANVTKIGEGQHKASIKGNGGKYPMTVAPAFVEDPGQLPSTLQKITVEPNTPEIRDEIETRLVWWIAAYEAANPFATDKPSAKAKDERKKAAEAYAIERANAECEYAQLAPRGKHLEIK